ncbi:MAG: nodulation protein NfeD [Desulfobacteraceae bacterium]|nr:nodulation protein NfeD [Desulfobacteraceae bacterium]
MKYKKTVILFLVLFFILFAFAHKNSATPRKKVYVIPISGDVEPGLAAFLERALKDVSDDPDALIIAEMDTFGGRVDSAFKMVDSLLNIPKGKTIAFVSKKAISAGALIALSCNQLVMKHSTTIGDCAPIIVSNDGPKIVGEKMQSPIRARFRSLAERNGYPAKLSESMVTAEMAVYKVIKDGKTLYMDSNDMDDLTDEEKEKITSKKTIVAEGELLTMTDAEARELGFSQMSVSDIEEMLSKMGIKNHEIIRIEETWSEGLVRFISMISPLLMMIGLAALYTELQSPGFGVPGIIGITCLAIVFLSQYFVGLADYTELLVVALGILLLGIEVMVLPGFGIAGFAGIICIVAGMVLAFQDFVVPNPDFPWEFDLLMKNIIVVLSSFVSAFIISMLLLRYVFPKFSGVVNGPYLTATLKESHADSIESMAAEVGDTGVVLTFLRPSGKAKIGKEVFDVITEGEFLEKGTHIEIMKISGNRIIVRRCRDTDTDSDIIIKE